MHANYLNFGLCHGHRLPSNLGRNGTFRQCSLSRQERLITAPAFLPRV